MSKIHLTIDSQKFAAILAGLALLSESLEHSDLAHVARNLCEGGDGDDSLNDHLAGILTDGGTITDIPTASDIDALREELNCGGDPAGAAPAPSEKDMQTIRDALMGACEMADSESGEADDIDASWNKVEAFVDAPRLLVVNVDGGTIQSVRSTVPMQGAVLLDRDDAIAGDYLHQHESDCDIVDGATLFDVSLDTSVEALRKKEGGAA